MRQDLLAGRYRILSPLADDEHAHGGEVGCEVLQELEELLTRMSGSAAPSGLAKAVFRETEGNPFFIEEVYQHLSEEGKLFDASGAWKADLGVDTIEVPEATGSSAPQQADRGRMISSTRTSDARRSSAATPQQTSRSVTTPTSVRRSTSSTTGAQPQPDVRIA